MDYIYHKNASFSLQYARNLAKNKIKEYCYCQQNESHIEIKAYPFPMKLKITH